MKYYEEIEIPATKEKRLVKTTCDLCGTVIKTIDRFDAEEIEVRHKTGSSYQEGGSGEEVSIDMCGKCFDEKLIPWLHEQGCDQKSEEWDW